jgi:hypothetical protein
MSRSPRFKVYGPDGEYEGAVKTPIAAAALAALFGDGATIRDGHGQRDILFTNGVDGCAGESYDQVAEVVERRIKERAIEFYTRRGIPLPEGWAEIIDRDAARYMEGGMLNPYVFGHVRFLASNDAVPRLIRLAAIRSEPPPLGSTGLPVQENGNADTDA